MWNLTWHTRKAYLQAALAEKEELVARLPIEAAQAHEELERAKRLLQEARAAHDAAEGQCNLLAEQIRAAKINIQQLTAELQLHEGQRPF